MSESRNGIVALILSVNLTPRNPNLIESLRKAGISHHVVTGSSPTIARDHFQKNFSDFRPYSIMSDSQLAGTFGHFLMYQRAIALDYDFTIFLEDDCELDFLGLKDFVSTTNLYPKGLVLLGACGGFVRKKPITIQGFSFFEAIGDTVAGAHAYVLPKSLYADFQNRAFFLQMLADSFHRNRETKMYVLVPYLATQIKDVPSFIPLIQIGQSTNPIRQILSSVRYDLSDRIRFGIWGGRFLRLPMPEKIAGLILKKLPGCKD